MQTGAGRLEPARGDAACLYAEFPSG